MDPNIKTQAETLQDLRDSLLDLNSQAESIQAFADSEKRDLTEDEQKRVDQIFAEFESIEKQIERRERINAQRAKLTESVGRKVEPEDPAPQNHVNPKQPERRPQNVSVMDMASRDRKWGWRTFGEFAAAVSVASHRTGTIDPRLVVNAPTTVSTTGTAADGGYAVPPDFREEILVKVMGEDTIIGRTDQLVTSTNSITMPTDETTPWQTTGGVQVGWTAENAQIAQSKVALGENVVSLHKLAALCPVTEELLSDAPAMDRYLRAKVPDKMDFAITDAILNGDGTGKPTGFIGHASAIAVAKENLQTADTIVFDNVLKMWSRMYGPWRAGAVWLINQDIEPQLHKMSFEGTSSSVPVYLPAGGLSASPYGTLYGRPVIATQACATVGSVGDICFVNLSQYMTATKTSGLRADVSMHLWFDYDTLAFRFILRIGGQPWHSAVITPKNGANTMSAFVTLAERA